jgi:hypothetical protein
MNVTGDSLGKGYHVAAYAVLRAAISSLLVVDTYDPFERDH